MLTQDFYGKKGFIWWVGIVQDTKDPLKTGSVRVRIIGLHPFEEESGLPDDSLVPEEKLPWAQVLLPPNAAMTTSNLREGDWVLGFFQDGEQAQIPVVTGMYPGYQSRQSQTVYQESPRIKENPPNVPQGVVVREVDKPTTARTSRGELSNTLIQITNSNLAHVCDVSNEMRVIISQVKIVIGGVYRAIKKAINSLLKALGFEPGGAMRTVVQYLKDINKKIQTALKFYNDEIKPYIDSIISIARYIRAMIDYILSLPDRLINFLRACLSGFTSSVVGQVVGLANEIGDEVGANFAELNSELSLLQQNASQLFSATAQVVAVPSQFVNVLLTPASPNTVNQISTSVSGFIANNYPTIEQQTESSTYNGTKGI